MSEWVVYTGGTFDLFHHGHVNFLEKCSNFGRVVVGLNTDDFVAAYKGARPILSYEERLSVLQACVYVDRVVENFGGSDSKPVIQEVKPDVIAIGSDWARKDYYAQMQFSQDWLDEVGISLLYIPYTRGISSTEVKRRSANSNRD